jgi:TetR/AcrR family transcriptional regulator
MTKFSEWWVGSRRTGIVPHVPHMRRRRAPAPEERLRDAERTRQRIVDAALQEFGAKGFAGARVADIAERAGVNQQLISYYFGGKQGLYDELLARWYQLEAALAEPSRPFADVVLGYLRAIHDQPALGRLLAWDELTAHHDGGIPDHEAPEVADIRRRQAQGELDPDLDPACLLLAVMGAVAAAVSLPGTAAQICRVDPGSPEFLERYSTFLRHLVDRLR